MYGVFAIYDAQTKLYMRPFYARTLGEAERSFRLAVENPDSDWAKTPADFSLFRVGEFDDESGKLFSEVAPVQVCTALQFVPAGEVRGVTARHDLPTGVREGALNRIEQLARGR